MSIRVLTADKKRVVAAVTVSDGKAKFEGKSRGESADLNDTLDFNLRPQTEYTVTVGDVTKTITTGKAGESQTIEVVLTTK